MHITRIRRICLLTLTILGLTACAALNTASDKVTSSDEVTPENSPLISFKFTPFRARLFESNELWTNFRHVAKLETQTNQPAVQKQIRRYQQQKKLLNTVFNRAKPYMYYIYQEVQKRQLPIEVALVPLIESDYNPFAYSRAGAAGLWQMMPGTASGYGIRQNWWYDGRRDIYRSTQAALKHLTYLRNYFKGDTLLALAAYDAGRGRVDRAITKNRHQGKSVDFWSLPLPSETQIYIPRLLALAEIVKQSKKYGISIPPIKFEPYLTRVNVQSQIDLSQAAKLADISLQELYQLNPGFNRWATDPNGSHYLVLPLTSAEKFKQRLATIPEHQRVSWTRYTVKQGDTLSDIAKKYKTRVSLIKEVNKLSSDIVHIKQELLIPKQAKTLTAQHNVNSRPENLTIPKNRGPQQILYTVQSGDNLARIAGKYKMKVAEIKFWNRVKLSRGLQPGMKLVLWRDKRRPTTRLVRYEVKSGDTLWKIARRYQVTTKALQRWNNKRDTIVRTGDNLLIYA